MYYDSAHENFGAWTGPKTQIKWMSFGVSKADFNSARNYYFKTLVVYFLHTGQTGWFTVWANGEQNSGKVNFVADSSLPFVQISFIYRKTAAKAWNWYQRWLWSKWNTNFRLEHSVLKNRTAFSEVPLLPENFYWNDPNGLVPFILQPDFPEIFCKW